MPIIAPDRYLPAAPGRHTPDLVGEAWTQANRLLRAALCDWQIRDVIVMVGAPGSGKSTWARTVEDRAGTVVFDAVFSIADQRRAMAARIKAAGKRAICVYMKTPLQTCMVRNGSRPRWRRVTDDEIRQVCAQLEADPPTVSEGWSQVIMVASR